MFIKLNNINKSIFLGGSLAFLNMCAINTSWGQDPEGTSYPDYVEEAPVSAADAYLEDFDYDRGVVHVILAQYLVLGALEQLTQWENANRAMAYPLRRLMLFLEAIQTTVTTAYEVLVESADNIRDIIEEQDPEINLEDPEHLAQYPGFAQIANLREAFYALLEGEQGAANTAWALQRNTPLDVTQQTIRHNLNYMYQTLQTFIDLLDPLALRRQQDYFTDRWQLILDDGAAAPDQRLVAQYGLQLIGEHIQEPNQQADEPAQPQLEQEAAEHQPGPVRRARTILLAHAQEHPYARGRNNPQVPGEDDAEIYIEDLANIALVTQPTDMEIIMSAIQRIFNDPSRNFMACRQEAFRGSFYKGF